MLYIVECAFSDPEQEQAWNDYYSGRKLDEVLAVPGFRTSQRFKAIGVHPSPYFAIHTVDSIEVLISDAYRNRGGGRFDALYQPYITHWRRSFYSGLARAPAFAKDELLAVSDRPEKITDVALSFIWLTAAGLDTAVPRRGIAWVQQSQARELAKFTEDGITLYAPLMEQRQESAAKQARTA